MSPLERCMEYHRHQSALSSLGNLCNQLRCFLHASKPTSLFHNVYVSVAYAQCCIWLLSKFRATDVPTTSCGWDGYFTYPCGQKLCVARTYENYKNNAKRRNMCIFWLVCFKTCWNARDMPHRRFFLTIHVSCVMTMFWRLGINFYFIATLHKPRSIYVLIGALLWLTLIWIAFLYWRGCTNISIWILSFKDLGPSAELIIPLFFEWLAKCVQM